MPKDSKALSKKESASEAIDQLVGGFIRRKQDPLRANDAAIAQSEQDGDPRFDFMVSSETLAAHPDRYFLWVPQEDVRLQSGKSRGFTACYGKDAQLANGVTFGDNEIVEWEGQVLMFGDRKRKEERDERERRANSERRKAILKRNLNNSKIIFVDGAGSAPAELSPYEG